MPVFQRFDAGAGRDDLLDRLQEVYQQQEARDPGGPSRQERLDKASEVLSAAKVIPFRLQGGDDASCLNLFQAGRPRVLGVPDELIDRGGFRFAQTEAETDEEKANPWLLLRKSFPDGAVPVFAEQNTALFMLKIPVGGTLTVPGRERLTGDGADRRHASGQRLPERIVDVGRAIPQTVPAAGRVPGVPDRHPARPGVRGRRTCSKPACGANGFTATRTTDKVAAYQAVVGAYLTTFQLLGGFALLLAVLGLGVVVLRSVWERVGELALLRAVGYKTGRSRR